MVMTDRKKIVLAILEKMGGYVSAICMQKYLFIYTRIGGGEDFTILYLINTDVSHFRQIKILFLYQKTDI